MGSCLASCLLQPDTGLDAWAPRLPPSQADAPRHAPGCHRQVARHVNSALQHWRSKGAMGNTFMCRPASFHSCLSSHGLGQPACRATQRISIPYPCPCCSTAQAFPGSWLMMCQAMPSATCLAPLCRPRRTLCLAMHLAPACRQRQGHMSTTRRASMQRHVQSMGRGPRPALPACLRRRVVHRGARRRLQGMSNAWLRPAPGRGQQGGA